MIPAGFKSRIGSVRITLSQFVDIDGIWAKRWENCVAVNITFEDGFETVLDPAEFRQLPKAQQDLVYHAPSSLPPVVVTPEPEPEPEPEPGDVTAPTVVSATVSDLTPNLILLTLSEELDVYSQPDNTDFVPSGSRTVVDVVIDGSSVGVYVDPPYDHGAVVTVSYVSGLTKLRDLAGNAVASFSGFAVTNSVTGSGAVPVTFTTLQNVTNSGNEVYTATSSATSQAGRCRVWPLVLGPGQDGWIEASKGAGGDGAIVIILDIGPDGNSLSYGNGDFIAQVTTAGGLLYGTNTTSLTTVPTYVLPESLLSLIRLRRLAGTVTFQSSEDGGVTWTTRHTFAGSSTGQLIARWYTTYSVTPRRIYRPRQWGMRPILSIVSSMQGQWVQPNVTRSTSGGVDRIYAGAAGTTGQFRVAKIDTATEEILATTTLQTNESDDHNVPAIIETNSGKILTKYATHSLQLRSWNRLSASVNSDDWGSIVDTASSDTTTYMQLARLAGQARIFAFYRVGDSALGAWVSRYSDDEGATWSAEVNLCPNTYITTMMDPDGVHLRCYGYQHPLAGSDHDIYYFRINLSNGDVIDSGGSVKGNILTPTGLPILESEQHKAVDVSGSTTTRMYDVGKIGVPSILASEFVDQDGGNYYRYKYDTPGGVFTRQLICSSGPAFYANTSDYFGGCCFDETNLDIVYCARNLGASVGVGSWELVKMQTFDGGVRWSRRGVIRATANIIARPYVRAGRLWWNEPTSYSSYTNFASSVRSLRLS